MLDIAILVVTIPYKVTPDQCKNDKFNYGQKYIFCTTKYGQCTTSAINCEFNSKNCAYGWQRNYWSVRDLAYDKYCVNEEKGKYYQTSFFLKLWPYSTIIFIVLFIKMWIWVWKICEDYYKQKEQIQKGLKSSLLNVSQVQQSKDL